jgi:hypothetical protein
MTNDDERNYADEDAVRRESDDDARGELADLEDGVDPHHTLTLPWPWTNERIAETYTAGFTTMADLLDFIGALGPIYLPEPDQACVRRCMTIATDALRDTGLTGDAFNQRYVEAFSDAWIDRHTL